MTIYMAVSADRYELPIYCTPYLMELAQKFGRQKSESTGR